MKLIIAGSRNFTNLSDDFIDGCVNFFGYKPSYVVCGCTSGIDMAGEYWADQRGITVLHFHPEWDKYGNRAGPIRNKKMAVAGDALLLIWDGDSKGSANMKKEMLALNKPVHEVILREYDKKVHKKDWGPGYRFFECECGYFWKEKSRDCHSPSISDCPECHEVSSPTMFTEHYEWPTDSSGNLVE